LRLGGIYGVELTKLRGVLGNLNVSFDPGETLHLAPEQRDELLCAVNTDLQLQHWLEVRLAFWKGASKAALDNVQNQGPDRPLRYKGSLGYSPALACLGLTINHLNGSNLPARSLSLVTQMDPRPQMYVEPT
jgi:hypothetical protein